MWKKKLGLEGVGVGVGGTFSILLLPRGGGLQFSYVIIWGGGG